MGSLLFLNLVLLSNLKTKQMENARRLIASAKNKIVGFNLKDLINRYKLLSAGYQFATVNQDPIEKSPTKVCKAN